jgi:hypothetical protein
MLEMNQQTRDALIAKKFLIPLPGKDEDGKTVYRREQLKLPNGLTVSLPALPIGEAGSIADKGLGITEDKAIFLGYRGNGARAKRLVSGGTFGTQIKAEACYSPGRTACVNASKSSRLVRITTSRISRFSSPWRSLSSWALIYVRD